MKALTLKQAASFLKVSDLQMIHLLGLDISVLTSGDSESSNVSILELKGFSEQLSLDFFVLSGEYLARKWHKNQSYGDKPYTYHLADVADFVYRNLHNKVDSYTLSLLIFLAWTHDLLEDTEITLAEIQSFIGDDPRYDLAEAAMIAISKGYFSADETNEEYLIRLLENPYAPAIKISDSESNLIHSIADGKVKLINKYTSNIAFISNHGFTTKSIKNLSIN